MIHYRSFRNPDPPAVAEIWNASLAGVRATSIPPRGTTILEYFTFAKLYFDPKGLILAEADGKPVGFVHAGFGPTEDRQGVDPSVGVICALGVIPPYRRRGIGTELLARGEAYLRQAGAKQILAGPLSPNNPFTFGLYGGCDSPGFLASDALARPFLEKRSYQVAAGSGLFQRPLDQIRVPADQRFFDLRQRCDITFAPYHKAGWYRECTLGPVEVVEYRLQDKKSGAVYARILLWVMELFGHQWNQSCVGLFDLQVVPEQRRRGMAKYLLVHTLRYLQDQPFELIEAQCDLNNAAGLGLLTSMGFEQVETGYCYRRDGE